jgi:ribonuclease Z
LSRTTNFIDTKIPNGPLGDPVVYCLSQRSGEALLLDLGDLGNLGNKEILKARHAAVSHTHLDHFIGFDRLLRVNVPHFKPLEISGPPGIIRNIQGKLQGYCWNLLEPGQIKILVHEIDQQGKISSAMIDNDHGFLPYSVDNRTIEAAADDPPIPQNPAACPMTLTDGTRIEAVVLDHGTPVCAYMLQSPVRYHIHEDKLESLGLDPGPWIRELQMAMAKKKTGTQFEINGQNWRAGDLANKILGRVASRPLAYLTDFIFNHDNLARLRKAFSGVERVICETNYRDADREKAANKKHLTTRQAALIAGMLGARNLETFHVSNLYTDRLDLVQEEAQSFFARFKLLDKNTLERLIEGELSNIFGP